VKVLVDMNLSPSWIAILERHGFPAVHWSAVEKVANPIQSSWGGPAKMTIWSLPTTWILALSWHRQTPLDLVSFKCARRMCLLAILGKFS
jgi:hypothetical protein